VGLLLAMLVLFGGDACGAAPDQTKKQEGGRRYAIVVNKTMPEDKAWMPVVEALKKKRSADIFYWGKNDDELRRNLAAYRPRYVCFVARPEELDLTTTATGNLQGGVTNDFPVCGAYYHAVGTLMRGLDDDPYDDAIWGILTGATPEDAMRVVSAQPLVVHRGLSHVGGGWLDYLESGTSFSEGVKGDKWIKNPGKPPEKVKGPDDTTAQFAAELNTDNVDMVSTSGHATEHDWEMGFSYKSGSIVPAAGHLLAVDSSNKAYQILTTNPKIYYSPGNCLIARTDGKDCLVLAWIHHGAMQFSGHVGFQSQSCYAWGIAEYFLSLQGRFSFAEAEWLNRQALRFEMSGGTIGDDKYMCCRDEQPCFDRQRMRFLHETTTFYGDPLWDARVKPTVPPLYDQELRTKILAGGKTELTFIVKMRVAAKPSRPAAFFLETRTPVQEEVTKGPKDMVITEGFALVPFWKADDPAPKVGDEYVAVVVL